MIVHVDKTQKFQGEDIETIDFERDGVTFSPEPGGDLIVYDASRQVIGHFVKGEWACVYVDEEAP